MKALVVGAGVGGLTAAVALRRAQASTSRSSSGPPIRRASASAAGSISGRTACARSGRSGSATRCRRSARRSSGSTGTRREHGVLASADLAATARKVGAPSVGIRRADLLGVLLDAVGEDAIRFGRDVRDEPRNADVVVGADGLHSTLRRELYRRRRAPRARPCSSVRARSRASRRSRRPSSSEVWAPGLRFGCYPFRDGLNWFAFVREAEAEELAHDPHGFLLERTRDWTAPGHEVIAATPPDAVTLGRGRGARAARALDGRPRRPPRRRAHAMTPFTGQGACQAIEDAVVLADCLRDEPDVAAALRAYEARRAAARRSRSGTAPGRPRPRSRRRAARSIPRGNGRSPPGSSESSGPSSSRRSCSRSERQEPASSFSLICAICSFVFLLM